MVFLLSCNLIEMFQSTSTSEFARRSGSVTSLGGQIAGKSGPNYGAVWAAPGMGLPTYIHAGKPKTGRPKRPGGVATSSGIMMTKVGIHETPAVTKWRGFAN